MEISRPRYIEFVLWVVTVSLLVIFMVTALGLLIGGDLLAAKRLLFVVGFLLFGIGSLGFQPKAPYKDRKRFTLESSDEHRAEEMIRSVPPLDDVHLSPDNMVSRNVKVFFVGLLVLGASAYLEFGLGVSI